MLSITLIIQKLWWVFALKDKWKNLVLDQQFVCIMELYKAVSQDRLELISNPFWFKMLYSAMTRTFGNRQRRITAVETYLSGLPPARSKLTHNKKCHILGSFIGLRKSSGLWLYYQSSNQQLCTVTAHVQPLCQISTSETG